MPCPSCESCSVLTKVNGERPMPNSLLETVVTLDVEETVLIQRECSECGWTEERCLAVEHILEASGDPAAIERTQVTESLLNRIENIEDVEKLREINALLDRPRSAQQGVKERGSDAVSDVPTATTSSD